MNIVRNNNLILKEIISKDESNVPAKEAPDDTVPQCIQVLPV